MAPVRTSRSSAAAIIVQQNLQNSKKEPANVQKKVIKLKKVRKPPRAKREFQSKLSVVIHSKPEVIDEDRELEIKRLRADCTYHSSPIASIGDENEHESSICSSDSQLRFSQRKQGTLKPFSKRMRERFQTVLFPKVKFYISCIAVTVAIFDTSTDWFALRYFYIHDKGPLTDAMLTICLFTSLMFLSEIIYFICAIEVFRAQMQGKAEVETLKLGRKIKVVQKTTACAEKKLNRKKEFLSYAILVTGNFPNVVILYIAYRKGNCRLFMALFKDTLAANLSLFGTVSSSSVQVYRSIKYGYCQCSNSHDANTGSLQVCCCISRVVIYVLSIALIAFSLFLLVEFNNYGTKTRYDCE